MLFLKPTWMDMGLRFHRSIRLLPGVRLNLSRQGMSLSIGGAPLTLNFGDGIRRITASLPGSGWSWSKRFGRKPDER